MADPDRLRIEYAPLSAVRAYPADWWHAVLALVCYAGAAPADDLPLPDLQAAQVHMPVLAAPRDTVEIWRCAGPIQSGRCGRVRYRRNGQRLFASLSVAEQEFAGDDAGSRDSALHAATRAAYAELFGALAALGYEHPLRIWNVLPEINGATPEGERYWHFNAARQQAFVEARRAICGNVPAASALGSPISGPLTVYCLAASRAPVPLENPRQLHAWDYPPQYGPRSPTFARACLDPEPVPALFVSGTSSIVGHSTAHAGDAAAQTHETMRNIAAVLSAANARLGSEHFGLDDLSYKVYVRRSRDQALIERELRAVTGSTPPALFLEADICRRDLLVEIEAVGA